MANRWVAISVVFLTRPAMGYQFQSIASVGPLLIPELGLSWAQLGSLIGLYMLPGVFFALPGGVIGQRFGERRVVAGSLGLMVVGSLGPPRGQGFAVGAARRVLSGGRAPVVDPGLRKVCRGW